MSWDTREYLRQRSAFFGDRKRHHPMLTATTLILTVTWFAGWGCSALLLWLGGVTSMPVRYAISFFVSYAAFFLCVRAWCDTVQRNRYDEGGGSFDVGGGGDPEGCLYVLAVGFAAFTVAGLFWASGGFAALLEAAFDVAFAGTVVRRLSRTEIVGHWARALLLDTWMQALAALLMLVSIAAVLQRAAPSATTFSQAVESVWLHRSAAAH
jgi:hypothetical protein